MMTLMFSLSTFSTALALIVQFADLRQGIGTAQHHSNSTWHPTPTPAPVPYSSPYNSPTQCNTLSSCPYHAPPHPKQYGAGLTYSRPRACRVDKIMAI